MCLRRASRVVQALLQTVHVTPGWSTWFASMWTARFCLVLELCKQSVHWNSFALCVIIFVCIIWSISSHPEMVTNSLFRMVSRNMLSQGFPSWANSVTILTTKGETGYMFCFNMNRHGIFVPRSVTTLWTAITRRSTSSGQTYHPSLNFLFKRASWS